MLIEKLKQKNDLINAEQKALREAQDARIQDLIKKSKLESIKYCEDNYDRFLDFIEQSCLRDVILGKFVIDSRQNWLHQCDFYVSRFLDYKFGDIRNWAIKQGLQVSTDLHAHIDDDYDRDWEGGIISDSGKPVYGPRITLSWKIE